MSDATAAGRWREQLEAWTLPQELLDAVPDSPYGLPPEMWRRRTRLAALEPEVPSTAIVRGLLPAGGSLLDVGAGAGRASLPLAREGHPLTAVERSEGMADTLRGEVAAAGVTVIEGSWPEVADEAGAHDVAMCAHVVYDVQALAPFLAALDGAAGTGVAVELTPEHPWAGLAPYYRALHDLDRPAGPTVDDFAAVVAEVLGVTPTVARWSRAGAMRFESREALLDLHRRRLLVPADRTAELEAVLAPDVTEADGDFLLGDEQREICTVWWQKG